MHQTKNLDVNLIFAAPDGNREIQKPKTVPLCGPHQQPKLWICQIVISCAAV